MTLKALTQHRVLGGRVFSKLSFPSVWIRPRLSGGGLDHCLDGEAGAQHLRRARIHCTSLSSDEGRQTQRVSLHWKQKEQPPLPFQEKSHLWPPYFLEKFGVVQLLSLSQKPISCMSDFDEVAAFALFLVLLFLFANGQSQTKLFLPNAAASSKLEVLRSRCCTAWLFRL